MIAVDSEVTGVLFDIDTFAVHDGPGIRMAVYFKGCPLSCRWCHSPESQLAEPELIHFRTRCVLCGACVQACARHVHVLGEGGHRMDRKHCEVCGACVRACPSGALQIKGFSVSARQVIDKAVRMKPFFDHSDGGITLTGGEVTAQSGFAEAILEGCRSNDISTAIETAGLCDWATLQRLADRADLILYDLKIMDERLHREYVGASNLQILENARRLSDYNVQLRVPLIPGMTESEENLSAIFSFAEQANLKKIALLPYNPSAGAKYEWLGQPYDITAQPQTPQRLEYWAGKAAAAGLEVEIG